VGQYSGTSLNSSIVTSTNGINWTAVSSSPFGTGTGWGVAWNGTRFVAVGQYSGTSLNSSIVTSTNGINWTPASPSPFGTGTGYGVAYNYMRANSITFTSSSTAGTISGPITTTPLTTSSTNNKLEFVSDAYFNRGYNNVSVCIQSSTI
jgi:hypothetical protein